MSKLPRVFKTLSFSLILSGLIFNLIFHRQSFATTGILKQINFQGKVVNIDGTNVADGNYDFEFNLYSVSSAGSPIWTETRTGGNQVAVNDGIFRVSLGSVTALPGSIDFNTDNIYLGINFNSDGEMDPRVRFTAVPYAFNALKVAGLTVTDTTGTFTLTDDKTLTVNNTLTLAGTDSSTLTFQGTDTYVGRTTTDTLTNKTIGSTGLVFSEATTDIDTAVGEALVIQGRGASSFSTTTGTITFQAAGTGTISTVQVGAGGAGSTTPDFLGLDVKSDTGDPAGGFEGATYYNTADNKFRCYQGTAWTDCIGSGGLTTLQQAYEAGNTISVNTTEGALSLDLVSANFDIEVGQGTDTGDFRIWDGTSNWFFIDESESTLSLGAATGREITIGGSGIVLAMDDASTSTQIELSRFQRTTSGTAADNIGIYTGYQIENDGGSLTEAGRMGFVLRDANVATNLGGEFVVSTWRDSAGQEGMWEVLSAYVDDNKWICGNSARENGPDCFGFTIGSGNDISLAFDGSKKVNWSYQGGNLFKTETINGNAMEFATLGDQSIEFDQNNDGADLYIDTSGEVGIGTNDPLALLSVGATSQFQVSSAGAVTAVGVNSGSGLLEGTAGLTITGATSINASGSNATNIGTGTNGGTITIGNGSTGDLALNDAQWSVTGAGAASFASVLTTSSSSNTYTGPGAVTISSGGSSGLTLNSASNTLTVDATDTALTASGLTTVTVGSGAVLTNASGNLVFQPAGSGTTANVQIGAGGAGSTTPDLLVLDIKSDAEGGLTGTNGAMYYNSSTNKFRCYQNGAWTDCIGGGVGGGVPKESHVIFFAVPTAISF